jgi:tetratricopeptide (TPR) repeat protein
MATRLVMMRERALKEAWQWFSQAEYGRARSSFQSVEMLDRSDPEPRLGMFLCSVADERYAQAAENFKQIMRRDMDPSREPFRDYNVAARYVSPRRMRADTRDFLEYYNAHTDELGMYVALCYYLWHTDAREEALRGAQQIIKTDPTGPGGRFGRLMLQAATGDDVAAVQ